MTDNATLVPRLDARSGWVRLRTLILLRWLAIAGQLATLLVAVWYLRLDLNLGLCLMAIGASVVANLLATFVYPENKRLSDTETMLTLLFDVSQLALLLYLTGGLNNPFALLILAPVTISATALRLRSILFLGMTAIVLITVIGFYHLPLVTQDGFVLRQPELFVFGFWLAIVIGIVFEAGYAWRVTSETNVMHQALLATQMALSREQKLTDLGGVVAAAAHELGTPLATIKLVTSELLDEMNTNADQRADLELIRDQTDRCRDILRSMGRAGKDDLHMRHAPFSAVVREAAEPHAERGKTIAYDFRPQVGTDAPQPMIRRQPEIIHGLRNLVQNAVDFAGSQVWVDGRWDERQITLRIIDDGAGFQVHLLGRIGDPFIRSRRLSPEGQSRPGYEGMGLGLFIAKTLLERTGAEVSFANRDDAAAITPAEVERTGAIAVVRWPRGTIERDADSAKGPLGENQPIAL